MFLLQQRTVCVFYFYDNAADVMFREHNVHTANQFANAVYGEFTAVDQ